MLKYDPNYVFDEKDFPILSPVICACSNGGIHKIEHAECRCSGQYRFTQNMYAPYAEMGQIPRYLTDEKGFPHCRYCGKYRDFPGILVVCTECSKKFPGPVPYFKVDFECPECEEELSKQWSSTKSS